MKRKNIEVKKKIYTFDLNDFEGCKCLDDLIVKMEEIKTYVNEHIHIENSTIEIRHEPDECYSDHWGIVIYEIWSRPETDKEFNRRMKNKETQKIKIERSKEKRRQQYLELKEEFETVPDPDNRWDGDRNLC
jgi:hypothetical protein